jgi:hypothetical protein
MIILAATPLGDPADASSKLVKLLGSADIVAAEDTRRVRRLASDLGVQITGRLMSFYDAVEASKAGDLVAAAADGATVLVVSDAGTPVISDPGYRLVAAAVGRRPGAGGARPVSGDGGAGRFGPPRIASRSRASYRADPGNSPASCRRLRRNAERWCSSNRRGGYLRHWLRWCWHSVSSDRWRCVAS